MLDYQRQRTANKAQQMLEDRITPLLSELWITLGLEEMWKTKTWLANSSAHKPFYIVYLGKISDLLQVRCFKSQKLHIFNSHQKIPHVLKVLNRRLCCSFRRLHCEIRNHLFQFQRWIKAPIIIRMNNKDPCYNYANRILLTHI